MKIILCLVGGTKVEAEMKESYLIVTDEKVGISKRNSYISDKTVQDIVVPVSLLEGIEIFKE